MHLSTFEDEDLYFTKADKNTKVNRLLNQSLNDNMDDSDNILDIDSWFNDELQSSMIFIFISCLIALIAFVLLLFLCYKHEKIRKILTFYMMSSHTAVASTDTSPCHRSDLYMYLLSAVCLTLFLYVILKLLLR